VDTTKQLPTVLSICTGYGGIERGLTLAGFEHRTVAHVEIEAFAAANLVAKMETGQLVPAPIWSDLKTLPAHCFRDRVDVLTGGYPCQPFSAAGLRQGTEDPRHLWPYIYDHIRTIRPVRCFFENVEGHISLGLREVIADLESLGYTVAWGIFSAAEVGAPHQRKRVYILAYATSAGSSSRKHANLDQNAKKSSAGIQPQFKRLRTDVADTKNHGHSSRTGSGGDQRQTLPAIEGAERGETNWRGESGRFSEDVPNANGSRLKQGDQEDARRPSEQPNGGGVRSSLVPNANRPGLQRRLQRKSPDPEGRQEQALRRATKRGDQWPRHGRGSGAPVSGLGRGFDGPASWLDGSWEVGIERVTSSQNHRVDRLRLLGNGVVPDTAAKAWIILNEQMDSEGTTKHSKTHG